MTIYTKIEIEGIVKDDFEDVEVNRTINEFNSTSSFKLETDNFAGRLSSKYALNDEIVIYADKDVNPATTKIFSGVIEDINYNGQELSERVTITGRDYGAVLQDMTVQPIVFKDRDVGEIAKVIIENNAQGIVTTDNIDTNTGIIVSKLGFNHTSIFEALSELAKLSQYIFFVDENKDVHFIQRNAVSSGLTFNNTNTSQAQFRRNDSQIYNKIWVYGDRILTGATDSFIADGTGSVFTLTDKPSNTRVTSAGVLQQTGGVFEMTSPEITSGLKYLVDFNEKDIIFVSGLAAGNHLPGSLDVITIEYDRTTPILKFTQDGTSIINYGPKTKIITDTSIKDYSTASEKAAAYLAENKDEKIQGSLELVGVLDVTPGQTAVADFPFQNINSQTYSILNVTYSFNSINNQSEHVVQVSLNKKIQDFTDTMKDQIITTRRIETGPLEGKLTRLETSVNDIDIDRHFEVWQGNVNNNFVFHSDKHGRLESPTSRIGTGALSSGLIISGGDF